MKPLEKNHFAKMLMAICELYGKKMSEALLSLYWSALERFSFDDIRRAITHHVNNPDVGQFMPKPADIVRYLEGDSETHALQAWAKVESAIRKVGSYASIAFDDPIIHVVIVEMGGWRKLCGTSTAEMPFRANEFMKRYQSYQHKQPDSFPRYLSGIYEHNNHSNGYHGLDETPVLVGDERLAAAVLEKGCSSIPFPIHYDNALAIKVLKKMMPAKQLAVIKKEKNKDHTDDEQ